MHPWNSCRFDNAAAHVVKSGSAPFGGLSFVSHPADINVAQITYTWTAANIGTADSTRQIIVGITARDTIGITGTISSVTVQGITATNIVSVASGAPSSGLVTGLWVASVPTGTTGDIVVTFGSTKTRAGICIYRLVGSTATASTQGSDIVNLTTPTKTFTEPSGGAAIMIASGVGGATASTVSNLTADVNTTITGSAFQTFVCGSDTSNAGSSVAFSCTYNSADSQSAAVWASIAP